DGARRARGAQAEDVDERGLRRPRSRRRARVTRPAGAGGHRQGPLDGVRVVDAGTRISAPFCAGLLGELGAEVIKVEQPGGGDFMRTIGPFVPSETDSGIASETDNAGAGYSLFWAVEGRGRKSVTCDLRQAD